MIRLEMVKRKSSFCCKIPGSSEPVSTFRMREYAWSRASRELSRSPLSQKSNEAWQNPRAESSISWAGFVGDSCSVSGGPFSRGTAWGRSFSFVSPSCRAEVSPSVICKDNSCPVFSGTTFSSEVCWSVLRLDVWVTQLAHIRRETTTRHILALSNLE